MSLVGQYANNFGSRKALLVTDAGVKQAGWAGQVETELQHSGVAYAIFDGLTSNPKDEEIMLGSDFYRREQCDVIIAVGGGSPMDCAKGIGIASTNESDVLAFEGIDKIIIPGPPLICIPTTAGSSADVSQFAIVTDMARRLKISIVSKALVPDVALIDPQTTLTMPPDLTAFVGMDALCHAFEAYASNASSPISDLYALKAISLILENIEEAIQQPQNLFYRNQMMLGSLMAGLAFSNTSLGLVHSMAHSLGGLLDLPHGECNAILLEWVVPYNFPGASEKYIRIGEVMGYPMQNLPAEEQKNLLQHGITRLRQKIGIHQNLSELGVTRADLPRLARVAYSDICLITNPVKPTVEEIESLYERAL